MDDLERYTRLLGTEVDVHIDRPLGSKHPRLGFVYETNYGYLPGTLAGDGSEIDAYVLGVSEAIEREMGVRPALSTSGGTSDSRFIKDFCPVLDFGLVGATMHKANEQTDVADIRALSRIYEQVLRGYFERA